MAANTLRGVAAIAYLLSSLLLTSSAHARCLVTVAPGDDVRDAFTQAETDGCSIHFLAGQHVIQARLGVTFHGTEDDPVVISGEGRENTALHRPDRDQNILDLSGTHLVVKDLAFSGGSRGLRLERSVAHARFERLLVHDTGDTAFSANTPGESYTHITVRRSEFFGTDGFGECLYLGCNNGACTFSDALITGNYCHDTFSSRGRDQGDGIDLKGGSEAVVVSHNVFVNTYGLAILAYANGGRRPNVFEGNVIVNQQGGAGIQVTGDAHVRNNVVILEGVSGEAGIIGHPENQGRPDNLQVLHNTVVRRGADGRCVAFRNWQADAQRFVVANNAIYCPGNEALYVRDNPQLGLIFANAIEGGTNLDRGTFAAGPWQDDLVAPFSNADAYPRPSASLLGRANTLLTIARDFNCRARRVPADVGAYARLEEDNLGWTGEDTFKRCVARPPALPQLSVPSLPDASP